MLQRWFSSFSHAANQNGDESVLHVAEWRRATPAGMVQFGSVTYRILRLSNDAYGIVRLVDDKFVGSFERRPLLKVLPEATESAELIASIARSAIRSGRTAWIPCKAG